MRLLPSAAKPGATAEPGNIVQRYPIPLPGIVRSAQSPVNWSTMRKKVEMLCAHLKRILGLGRLRLRVPCGANDEFLLAATAQNLRKLAKIFPALQQLRKA